MNYILISSTVYNKNKTFKKHPDRRYGMESNVNYSSPLPSKGSSSNQSGYNREKSNTKLPYSNGTSIIYTKVYSMTKTKQKIIKFFQM